MSAVELSVVVPVHRSAATLPDLVARLERTLRARGERFEVVLVDDASPDRSWEVLERCARGRPWLRAVGLERNVGQHRATLCGVRLARGAVVVTLDDDLQHPPEALGALVERVRSGVDLVYGPPQDARSVRRRSPRGPAARAVRALFGHATGVAVAQHASSFRAFRSGLRDAFDDDDPASGCLDVLLARGARTVDHVPVPRAARAHGRSGYGPAKLVRIATGVLVGLGPRRLGAAALAGALTAVASAALASAAVPAAARAAGLAPLSDGIRHGAMLIASAPGLALLVIAVWLARRRPAGPPYAIVRELAADEDAA